MEVPCPRSLGCLNTAAAQAQDATGAPVPQPPRWYLQLPDVLALLGDLAHGLPHEGDEHVEEEHEGEDDVGDEEDDEDAGVLGALEHLQVAHADGELEEVKQEGAEGLAVPAGWVGGHRAVGLLAAGLAAGTRVEEGHQGWGRRDRDSESAGAMARMGSTVGPNVALCWMRPSPPLEEAMAEPVGRWDGAGGLQPPTQPC